MTPLQTNSASGVNITTAQTVASYANGNSYITLRPKVQVTGLNAAAATLTYSIRNTTDGATIFSLSKPKGATSDTADGPVMPSFIALPNKTYAIQIQSSNASDTAAAWSVAWMNASTSTGVVSANVVQIAGTTQATGVVAASVQSYATGVDPTPRVLALLAPVLAAAPQSAGSDGMTISPQAGVGAGHVGGVVYRMSSDGLTVLGQYSVSAYDATNGIMIPGLPDRAQPLRFALPGVSAEGVRAAIGQADANLDTTLAAIAGDASSAATNTANIPTRVPGVLPTTANFTSGSLIPGEDFFNNSPASDGALTTEQAAALQATADKVALLQVGKITSAAPVAQDGHLRLIAGDEYSAAIGNVLLWTISGHTGPAPESVTLALITTSNHAAGATIVELTATGTASLVSNTLTASVPLTMAQTAGLEVVKPDAATGNYRYQLFGTYSGKRRSLAYGFSTVDRAIAT